MSQPRRQVVEASLHVRFDHLGPSSFEPQRLAGQFEPAGDLFCDCVDDDGPEEDANAPSSVAEDVGLTPASDTDGRRSTAARMPASLAMRATSTPETSMAQATSVSESSGARGSATHNGRTLSEERVASIVVHQSSVAEMSQRLTYFERSTGHPSAEATTEDRTTVMLQRISYTLDENGVRRLLDQRGFRGTHNAVYVPRNPKRDVNLGYAFVNFVLPEQAAACIRVCSGCPFGEGEQNRNCSIAYSTAQGFAFMSDRMDRTVRKKQQPHHHHGQHHRSASKAAIRHLRQFQ